MTSFMSVRSLLFLALEEGYIDEEEFLLLTQHNTSLNAEHPYTSYPTFDLENKDEAECKSDFRFEKR